MRLPNDPRIASREDEGQKRGWIKRQVVNRFLLVKTNVLRLEGFGIKC